MNSDIRDFFYFSSVKAVADVVDGILTENAEGIPITPYGQSKLKAEQYILSQSLPDGKRVFIIRPCMIHGPGNKGNLNLLYNIVKKGIPWPLAAYNNKRSYLSINPRIISFLANVGDLIKLPLNTERLTKLTENYVVSNEKVKKALGIEGLPLSVEQGLKNTIESFNVNN